MRTSRTSGKQLQWKLQSENHRSLLRQPLKALALALAILTLALNAQAYKDNVTGRVWTKVSNAAPNVNVNEPHTVAWQNQIWMLVSTGDDADAHNLKSLLYRSSDGKTWSPITPEIDAWPYSMAFCAFQNKLWLLGLSQNSADGLTWQPFQRAAQYPLLRGGSIYPVIHNNALWVVDQNAEHKNCLWRSTDGANWALIKSGAPIEGASAYLVSFAGKLWLFVTPYIGEGASMWNSADGINWSRVASAWPWGDQIGLRFLVLGDTLFMIGSAPFSSDSAGGIPIWSTRDGLNWSRILPSAPWAPRMSMQTVVFDNKLWVIGGQSPIADSSGVYNYFNDVWCSGLPSGAPAIAALPAQRIQEKVPYTALEPALTAGDRPITWSLVNPPAGMTVDPATGIVRWPAPATPGKTYPITLRAANAKGSCQVTWPLTVDPRPAPTLIVPQWAPGASCTVSWSAVPNISGYTVQYDDAPDFATPLGTVPLAATVTRYTFNGLASERTYWYRVRANRLGGLTNVFSAAKSCTQDILAPAGSLRINNGAASTSVPYVALTLTASDPGRKPSGVVMVSIRVDAGSWSPWRAMTSPCTQAQSLPYATGLHRIYARFKDRAGNASAPVSAAITLTGVQANTLSVDAANTQGPWLGTAGAPLRTIQAALDAATTATRQVVVAPGIYQENLNFKGKSLVLRSLAPQSLTCIRSTVVNGQGKAAAVAFAGSETAGCRLEGFTITNGAGTDGGGIQGHHTHATIQHNIITNNVAREGLIEQHSTSHQEQRPYNINLGVIDVWITVTDIYSTYQTRGGGLSACDGLIQNNIIAFNRLGAPAQKPQKSGKPLGSGIRPQDETYYHFAHASLGSALYACAGVIRNNTIYGNGASGQSALAQCGGTIRNNIVWENSGSAPELLNCAAPTYCCIQGWTGGGAGNLAAAPGLADPLHGDFRLKTGSPCLDAGGAVPGLLVDMIGSPRGIRTVSEARGDGSCVDMGAFESVAALPVAAPVIGPAVASSSSPLRVTVACATTGAAIHYTSTGAEPTTASPRYTGPVTLRGTPGQKIVVKARAFKSGMASSPLATRTYAIQ